MNREPEPEDGALPDAAAGAVDALADPARLDALSRYDVLDIEPDRGLDGLARLAAEICDTRMALIAFVDDRRQYFKAAIGFAGDRVSPLEVGFCPQVVRDRAPVTIPDARAHPAPAADPAARDGVGFYAGVPLTTPDGHVLGTLCVLDAAARPAALSDRQRQSLDALADQVVSRLELRRSEAVARRETARAEKHARRLSVVAQAATLLLAATDPAATVAQLLALIRDGFGIAIGFHYRCGGGALGLVAAIGLTPEQERAAARVEFGQMVCGIVAARREPMHVADIRRSDEELLRPLRGLGLESYYSTPLIAAGELLGTISFGRRDRDFSPGEIEALRTITSQLAVALQRQRTEAEMRKSELRLTTALESARLGAFEWDPATGAVLLDARSRAIFGFDPVAAIADQDVFDRIHPDDLEAVQASAVTAAQTGTQLELAYRIVLPNGTIRVVDSFGVFLGSAASAGAMVGVFADITARRDAEDALRASEEELRFALQAGRFGAWRLDLRSGELTTSATCRANFGRAADAPFSYAQLQASVHPDDRARMLAAVERSIATHADYDIEYRTVTPDGQVRWIAIRAQPAYAEDGTPLGMAGVSIDIDERRRTEVQLAHTQTRYRALFDALDAGFCIIELKFDAAGRAVDYRHVEINPAFGRQTGLADHLDVWVSDALPDLERHWFDIYGEVARTGRPVRFENRAEPLGRWFDVHAFRIEGEENRVAILFTDITDRRRSEEQLRTLNETLEEQVADRTALLRRYHDIIESTASPVVAFDTDLRITVFNRAHADAYRRVYGIEQRIGDSFPDQFVPEQAELVRGFMQRALGGESFTVREAFGDPEREVPAWQIDYYPLRDEQGAIIGAFHHATDITAELRTQDELNRAQDALRQSQKMEAIGQLTGGVAHDFNNLLTVIRGSVDLLRRDDVAPDRRRRYLDAIGDTADRAAKLTGQLLAFARRQTLEPEVIDVGQRLDAIGDMLDSITGARVAIRYEIPNGVCRIRADVSQFETALVNMAVNARDAMNGEGTVTIRLRCDARMPAIRGHGPGAGSFVAISLADTGIGIPPDDLERIFEPFFTTKEVGKGTGLGLSQVFGFAKQSGGDVEVESVVARGSTFTLYLPQVGAETMASAKTTAPDHGLDGGGRCVLVVEDNISVGQFATQLLDDLGYRTAWVTSAEEALDRLGADGDGIDIVFSDVVMPGMGGIELARRLARDLPAMPVVLASGYSHVLVDEGVDGLELIRKPYSANQLSTALQRRMAWTAAMQA